jgi:hypothetical protein
MLTKQPPIARHGSAERPPTMLGQADPRPAAP